MAARKRTLLLVGGAGRMGRTLGVFFRRRGFRVGVVDPAGTPRGTFAARLEEAATADVVVVTTSLEAAGEALEAVFATGPRGLVFDVSSVKARVEEPLRRAVTKGFAAASVHPMFGPDVRSFRGRDLIVCDAGNAAAARRVRRLFEGAGLKIATMPLDAHDPWVARTMGLAHFVALAAASTLGRAGVDPAAVDGLASTSFRRLLTLALPILDQPGDLTRPIQALNPDAGAVLELFAREVEAWRRAIEDADPRAFESMLAAARKGLRPPRAEG